MLLENVVIGHSMESALFAYVNDFYHIQSSNFYPLFFDESRGFSLFGTSNKKQKNEVTRICELWPKSDMAEYKKLKRVHTDPVSLHKTSYSAEFEILRF